MSLARHLRAIGLLPGTVLVVAPALILWRADAVAIGWSLPFPASVLPVLAGAASVAFGLGLMYRTIRLLATRGQGTLAPWDPTSTLVVEGPYRHVRNPMISGVMFVLLGEATLFGSPPLLAWFGAFALANALFIPLFEEPGLHRRFGGDYDEYKRNVPRWVPRRTPWEGYPRGSSREEESRR